MRPDRPHHADGRLVTTELPGAVLLPDPFAVLDATGRARLGAAPATLPPAGDLWARVIPLEAGPSVPLGRFLGVSLPSALTATAAAGSLPLIGPSPTLPQAEALAILGLDTRHTVLSSPLRVAGAVLTHGPGREAAGSRLMRQAVELLRFTVEPYEVRPVIAILTDEAQQGAGRALRDALIARGAGLLDPAAMRLDDIRLGLGDLGAVLAAARLVVTDDPVSAPLLGLCDPGTPVIAPCVAAGPHAAIARWAALFALDLVPAPLVPPGPDAALDRAFDMAAMPHHARIT